MNHKPDNKCENHDDIILLSEIIEISIYWQELKCEAELSQIKGKFYSISLILLDYG